MNGKRSMDGHRVKAANLRDAVLEEIQQWWTSVSTKPDNDKVMGTPPDDITVFEFADARFKEGDCAGKCSAVETRNRTGNILPPAFEDPRWVFGNPRPCDLQPYMRGAYWIHAIACFHISEGRGAAILTVVFGPRYGRGFRFEKHGDGSIWMHNVWVS